MPEGDLHSHRSRHVLAVAEVGDEDGEATAVVPRRQSEDSRPALVPGRNHSRGELAPKPEDVQICPGMVGGKNKWLWLNGAVPIEAHDAKTTFAYDSRNDVFLLTDGNQDGKVAVFSLAENKWELVTPSGGSCLPSDSGGGPYWGQPKGYYDATHNVLVIHGGYTNRVWLYRHR